MKILGIIILVLKITICQGQGNCQRVNDTMLVISFNVWKENLPSKQLWCTSKSFNINAINKNWTIDSLKSFLVNEVNYCPFLPDGYRQEVRKCMGVSSVDYLDKNEVSMVELFQSIKKDAVKNSFSLKDNWKIQISVVKETGLFLIRDLAKDQLGTNSNELIIEKERFKSKIVYVPLETKSIKPDNIVK